MDYHMVKVLTVTENRGLRFTEKSYGQVIKMTGMTAPYQHYGVIVPVTVIL